MEKWDLATELIKKLCDEFDHGDNSPKYETALRDAIDALETLKTFW